MTSIDNDPVLPFRVSQLLFSRLCHDLISPAAAVSNGLELLDDGQGRIDPDVMGLLNVSAGFAPADVDSVSGLLSIQEVQDPAGNRERAAKRGRDILEELDRLRHGLLDGTYSEEKLIRLVTLSRQQADAVADPRLREVIGEIELRAAVELAKLGKEF